MWRDKKKWRGDVVEWMKLRMENRRDMDEEDRQREEWGLSS